MIEVVELASSLADPMVEFAAWRTMVVAGWKNLEIKDVQLQSSLDGNMLFESRIC